MRFRVASRRRSRRRQIVAPVLFRKARVAMRRHLRRFYMHFLRIRSKEKKEKDSVPRLGERKQ